MSAVDFPATSVALQAPSMHKGWAAGRFARIFRQPAWLIAHAWSITLVLLLAGAAVSVLWSPHIGIAFTAFAYFLLCFRMEARHLDQFIVPPMVLIGFQHMMSCGLGLPMVWYGMMHRYGGDGAFNEPIFLTQLCHAIGFPILMLGYHLFRKGATPFRLAPLDPQHPAKSYRLVALIGWFFLLHYMVLLVVGYVTGGTDRARENEFIKSGVTTWSLFNTLPRFPIMYFVLLPLMYRLTRTWGRIVLIACNSFLFFTFITAGSRGALLTPICLMLVGWWSFCRVSRRVIIFMAIMVMLTLPYVPLIALYRSTDAFQNSRQGDWLARIAAFGEVRSAMGKWDLEGLIQLTGDSFLGVNDRLIFARTPSEIPYAGWQDIERLKLFWLPSQFAPDKKPLLDGNEIVSTYMDNQETSGSGISFSADMYRRFGWSGILAGNLCLGLFLGRFSRWVFRLQARHKELWAVLLLVYFTSYFTSTPFHSLLSTAWIWMWEFPKHLVVLYVLVLIAGDIDRTPRISTRSKAAEPKMVMPAA
jgi:hypothetical protein